jgi:hypothetical protein
MYISHSTESSIPVYFFILLEYLFYECISFSRTTAPELFSAEFQIIRRERRHRRR